MHHVPYTYKLHSGKTVIQYLYDSHYEGAEAVEGYVREWKTLEGPRGRTPLPGDSRALEYQAGQAQVWRDAVNNWFHRASGIADAKERVGKHPGRFEAEAMSSTAMRRGSGPVGRRLGQGGRVRQGSAAPRP